MAPGCAGGDKEQGTATIPQHKGCKPRSLLQWGPSVPGRSLPELQTPCKGQPSAAAPCLAQRWGASLPLYQPCCPPLGACRDHTRLFMLWRPELHAVFNMRPEKKRMAAAKRGLWFCRVLCGQRRAGSVPTYESPHPKWSCLQPLIELPQGDAGEAKWPKSAIYRMSSNGQVWQRPHHRAGLLNCFVFMLG